MDPDVISFAVVSTVIVALLGVVAVMGVWVVRALKKKSAPPEISNRLEIEARFDQIQQAVDAIAVEVERITEAQRFSAKLLAEQSESRAALRQ
jgi:Na+-transporting methylmalonyl-CoA/oxaloacetate decarboxylase gamma subunit